MPAHIAIDARIINSSTGTFVERMLTNLQELDQVNRYSVLVPTKDLGYWQPRRSNFQLVAADIKNYSLDEQTKLRTLIQRLRPDLIHFCMPQQPLFFYRGRKITTIHDLTLLRINNARKHALSSRAKRAVGWLAFAQGARESARVITASQYVKDDLVRSLRLAPAKVRVVHDAADAGSSELEPYTHPFGRYLLFVGAHYAYKNLLRLCDAHQQLLAGHPDLGLIFVGRPDRETQITQAHVAACGYRNVLFTGFLPDGQRDWLYRHAAAYVFPSLSEGFGLPGLEAMGHGTPVASSNATCLPEIYGQAAAYFDPESVPDMARAIARILDDDAYRESLIAKGHERPECYSWRRMAEETLEIYREVLAASARHDRRGGSAS